METRNLGDEGSKIQPPASRRPGNIWKPNGIRQDHEPETARIVGLDEMMLTGDLGYALFRVRNASQNPTTTPNTMENCSIESRDPLISGGLEGFRVSSENKHAMRVGTLFRTCITGRAYWDNISDNLESEE